MWHDIVSVGNKQALEPGGLSSNPNQITQNFCVCHGPLLTVMFLDTLFKNMVFLPSCSLKHYS